MPPNVTRAAIPLLLPMFLSVAVLVFVGIVSIDAWTDGDGKKQAVYLAVAAGAFFAAQLVNYRRLLRLSPLLYALSLVPVLYTVLGRFMAVPLVPERNGACAWIIFGPISLQPAELTKLSLVLLLAWNLREGLQERAALRVMLRCLLLAAVPMALILQQPDLGTVLTLIPPVLVMLFLAGVPARYFVGMLGVAVIAAPLLWFSGTCRERTACTLCPSVPVLRQLPQFVKHYQRARVQAMYSDDPRVLQVAGYQQQRALEAMGSGGLWGKGRGSIPIGLNVPEAHNDMILALIGEQYGLIGIAMVLLAYALLLGSAGAIAAEQRDQGGKMLAIGLVTLLAGQAILNLAVTMRLMPVTGVTLPFVSYGGSSLVASFLAIALVVNVARNQKKLLL